MNVCFFITSVLHTVATPLTYAPRSYYSEYERYKQTLGTIESIRAHVPHGWIYFLEGSHVEPWMETVLESAVDRYVNLADISYIEDAVVSPLKEYGEAALSLYFLDHIIDNRCDHIFKISGRYYLTDEFNLWRILLGKTPTFCKGKKADPLIVSTVLYYFRRDYVTEFVVAFKKMMEIYGKATAAVHFERLLPTFIQNITIVDKIGVAGLVSSYLSHYRC